MPCWPERYRPEPQQHAPPVRDFEHDGPAQTLGERFLWRLFDGANKKWLAYKDHTASKAKLAEALTDVGRPVLILIDEIMDYLRWASNKDEQLALADMAFLRALLDTVNDVSNCALVVVMIASDKDRIVLNELGQRCQGELEDLLIRNGEATTVSSGGDFADIIRRRLFENPPPAEVTAATAKYFQQAMTGTWSKEVFSKTGGNDATFSLQIAIVSILKFLDQRFDLLVINGREGSVFL